MMKKFMLASLVVLSVNAGLVQAQMYDPTSKQQQIAQLKAMSAQGEAFVNAGTPYRVMNQVSLASADSATRAQAFGDYNLLLNTPNVSLNAPVVVFNEATSSVGIMTGEIMVIAQNMFAAQTILQQSNLNYEYLPTINQFVIKTQPGQALALKKQLSSYPELTQVRLVIEEGRRKPN